MRKSLLYQLRQRPDIEHKDLWTDEVERQISAYCLRAFKECLGLPNERLIADDPLEKVASIDGEGFEDVLKEAQASFLDYENSGMSVTEMSHRSKVYDGIHNECLALFTELMKVPEDVLDYVVVHELCHRLEMNHSPRFWKEVENIFPDYRVREKWLRENGKFLIRQVHG